MRLYKRDIRVLIGADNTGVEIKNLFIEFEVVKEAVATPGEGFVRVYNLNENTETRIKQKFEQVRIFAGYGENTGLIFNGDGRRVERDREELNRITTVTIGGNVSKITRARVNRSYEGQVTVRQIVTDALPSFNLDFDSVDVIPIAATQEDFAFSGRTSDLLKKILTPLNIYYYEVDGVVGFSVIGETPEQTSIVINEFTGMVGTPSITDEGVKVKMLLNHQLNVNALVQIQSEVLDRAPNADAQNAKASEQQGVYKITKLTHKGDNREGEFLTEILAVPV